ncbi:5'-3' exoribonuclease 2 [Fasciola hepatica]|uniref:5'-3' exoribonuclease 2 n=1 Tax=Fasciola hepatica TaxID=6192 RepID=A0A4E0RJH1_FASHE|nr:5'-3' exoribonuclease 2 [Fasciola hepatica]
MGVPAFFRWLSLKYPSIVSHCVEKRGPILDNNGTRGQVDTTEPNPNGEEFDNLYLDMNGIIHPCTHPESKPAPKNEAEMFVAIFEYIDRLFAIIRPRRLLYMAVDGVAPRAKMNQQRSRRFRAAKESREKHLTVERLRHELMARGAHLPPGKDAAEYFDSNCITPGTPFMARLAVALRYYIYDRLNSDPGWKNIMVFLSDANVPGEGEHKIMDFIRRQRSSPSHDANTRHCLCGADADLIMLGLATHEPYFTIIREEFKPNQPRPCELCGQMGHEMENCVGAPKEDEELDGSPPPIPAGDADFIFIRLNVLREYLSQDLKLTGIPFEWDLERVIDDWVFMCFFVGNDFLPHLPSLEIREGAIDRLIEIYRSTVQHTGGWLTDSGKVNMPGVQVIMHELGKMEDEIFKSRRRSELNFRRRNRDRNGSQGPHSSPSPQRMGQRPQWNAPVPQSGLLAPVPIGGRYGVAHPQGRYRGPSVTANEVHQARQFHNSSQNVDWVDRNLNNLEAATAMKAMLKPRRSGEKSIPGVTDGENSTDDDGPSPARQPRLDSEVAKKGRLGGSGAEAALKKPPPDSDVDMDEVADANDEVRLWEDGWRARYYQSKFGVDPEDAPEFCIQVGREYARGLCWVLAYYYQGCVSWDWYYPYHYAPFASDFQGVDTLDPGFDKVRTKPFRPLEQLMGVFPADSRSHVPPAWQDLMTDPDSPIIDFYPTDFKVDLNGKRYLWMGVALLPFVDEVRLLSVLDSRRHLLTNEELARNIRGPDRLFCRATHPLATLLESLYENDDKKKCITESLNKVPDGAAPVPDVADVIEPKLTQGVSGRIWPDYPYAYLPGARVPSGVPSLLPDLEQSHTVSVCFADPYYPDGFIFPARLLKSVKLPPPTHLQPPQRGRGRGFSGGGGGGRGNGFEFNSSSERGHRRFNSTSATQYYARDSSSDREQCFDRPMDRMIRHALPSPNRGPRASSVHVPNTSHSRHFLPRWGSAPVQENSVPPNPYGTHTPFYGTPCNGQFNRPFQTLPWPRPGGGRGGPPPRGWRPPPRYERY